MSAACSPQSGAGGGAAKRSAAPTSGKLPVAPRSFLSDFVAAARFRLAHKLGEYNAVQRVLYRGVMLSVIMMLLSGLAIWKPAQLAPLTALFGGFQGARLVHFIFMTVLALFLVVHVALVVYPFKIRIPIKLGFKNPKFVTTIYVTNKEPRGFWTDRGYNWFSGS
jgi:thiosulfate reductase cytochrome b subunit